MKIVCVVFFLLTVSICGHAECDTALLNNINRKLEQQTTLLHGLLSQGEDHMNGLASQLERQAQILERMEKRVEERDRLLESLIQNGVSAALNDSFQDMLRDMDKEKIDPNAMVPRYQRLIPLARDCADIQASGEDNSGVYNIVLPHSGKQVSIYCDMTTDGGGWLVFLRRINGTENFYRNYINYVNGFGDPHTDFWLGLDALYSLTSTKEYEMRVDMTSHAGMSGYAHYTFMEVAGPQDDYRLNLGDYTQGNAGDSLSSHNGEAFSTKDHDTTEQQCAHTYRGGWWFHSTGACAKSNLNGVANAADVVTPKSMVWYTYQRWHALATASMMIRPPK